MEAGSRRFRTFSVGTREAHAASRVAIPKRTSTSRTASALLDTRLYVQDTWRVGPTLTLDLGLRYAFHSPLTDENDMLFTFSPDAYDPGQAPGFADPDGFSFWSGSGNLFNGIRVAGKDSPHGRAIYGADKNNLQPRIGAAWDPVGQAVCSCAPVTGCISTRRRSEWSLRMCRSLHYDPFRTDLFVSNAPLSTPASGTVIEPFGVVTPFALATSEQFVAPRWQHWNIGVQRRLYSRGVIDAGYVGSRGDHLVRYVDINRPQPADLAARPHRRTSCALPRLRLDRDARDDGQEPLSWLRDQLSS